MGCRRTPIHPDALGCPTSQLLSVRATFSTAKRALRLASGGVRHVLEPRHLIGGNIERMAYETPASFRMPMQR